jgi:hypothetical protein
VAPPGQKQLSKFTIPIRVGLLMGGSGKNHYRCSGDCLVTDATGDDYIHRPGAAFTVDFLFKVGPLIRLGPGLGLVLPTSIKSDNAGADTEIGSDVALDFIFEVAPRVGNGVWLVPRGEFGLTVLSPTGDLKTSQEARRTICDAKNGSNCDSITDARPGFNAGIGFGGLFAVSDSVRLRADLLAQFYVVNLYTYDSISSGLSTTESGNVSGSRFFLFGGIEFL